MASANPRLVERQSATGTGSARLVETGSSFFPLDSKQVMSSLVELVTRWAWNVKLIPCAVKNKPIIHRLR